MPKYLSIYHIILYNLYNQCKHTNWKVMFKSKVKPPNWGYITVLTTPPLFLVCAVPMFNSIQGSTQCLLQPWMFHEPANCSMSHWNHFWFIFIPRLSHFPMFSNFFPFSHFFQFLCHFYAMFLPCSPVVRAVPFFRSWSATPAVRGGRVSQGAWTWWTLPAPSGQGLQAPSGRLGWDGMVWKAPKIAMGKP